MIKKISNLIRKNISLIIALVISIAFYGYYHEYLGMGRWYRQDHYFPLWFKFFYVKSFYFFLFVTCFSLLHIAKNFFFAYTPKKKKNNLLNGKIKTPPFPYPQKNSEDFRLLLGEIGTQDGFPKETNSFYFLPAKGLATGIMTAGAVGGGKTTNLHPWIRQLISYNAQNYRLKMGGLNLDYKGDMTSFIEEQAIEFGREHDLLEIKLCLSSKDKRKIKNLKTQLEFINLILVENDLTKFQELKLIEKENLLIKLNLVNSEISEIEKMFAQGDFSSREHYNNLLSEKETISDELDSFKFCFPPEENETAYNKSINICINDINTVKERIQFRIKRISKITCWNVVWAPEVSPIVVADMISKAVINIRGKDDKDPFWDLSSKDLIRIFVQSLRFIYREEYFTLDDMNYFFDADEELSLLLEKHLDIAKSVLLEKQNKQDSADYLMLKAKLEEEYADLTYKNISPFETLYFYDEDIKKHYSKIPNLSEKINYLERTLVEYRGGWLDLEGKLKGTIKKNFSIILNAFSDVNYNKIFSPKKEENDFEGFLNSSIQDGKIVVVNIPMSQNETVSKLVSIFLKLLFQGTMQKRVSLAETNPKINMDRYCFMLVDECHFFLTSSDPEYLSVSRQSKAINIFLTQLVEQIEQILGEKMAKVLLGNIRTKIFYGSASSHTAKYAQEYSKTIIRKKERLSTSESANAKYSTITGQVERHSKNSNISTSTTIEEKEEKLFKSEAFLNLQLNQAIIFGFDGDKMLPETVLYTIPIYDPVWKTGKYESFFNKYKVNNLDFFRKDVHLEEK